MVRFGAKLNRNSELHMQPHVRLASRFKLAQTCPVCFLWRHLHILEADGSANFLRADGALKSFYSDFSAVFGHRMQSVGGGGAVRSQ